MTSSSSSSMHSSTTASSSDSSIRDMGFSPSAAGGVCSRGHVGALGRTGPSTKLRLASTPARKASTGGALLCRDQTEFFQTRLDSAQRASVLVCQGDRGVPLLEGSDEPALLLGRPRAADV